MSTTDKLSAYIVEKKLDDEWTPIRMAAMSDFPNAVYKSTLAPYERITRYAPADKATAAVGELLAIIHGDGGHYEAQHGTEKAARDAIAVYYAKIGPHADTAALRKLQQYWLSEASLTHATEVSKSLTLCANELATITDRTPPPSNAAVDGYAIVPREVLSLYEFMALAFVPFTAQQEQIDISLQKAKKAMVAAPQSAPKAADDEPLFTASMYGTAERAAKAREEWLAAKGEPQWQPIETLQPNVLAVLLCANRFMSDDVMGQRKDIGYITDTGWFSTIAEGCATSPRMFSHWSPIPRSLAQAEQAAKGEG